MKAFIAWFKSLFNKPKKIVVAIKEAPVKIYEKIVVVVVGGKRMDKVILHCAATFDSMRPNGKHWDIDAADVDRWHKKRGWRGIGYHFFIKRDGTLEAGRKVGTMGAHTRGQNHNIGVCYSGTYKPTKAQLVTLVNLSEDIRAKYGISPMAWEPHNKYANKTCPGFDKEQIQKYLLP